MIYICQLQRKQLFLYNYHMFVRNLDGHNCVECGLNFQTPIQLQNHKRRFCLNSGYDNLQGLAKIQFHGEEPSHKPAFSHKNYLKQIGANSLTKIGQYDQLNTSNLQKDMGNIHRFKRQLEGVQKYKHNQKLQSSVSGSAAKHGQSRMTNNSYSESRLQEELKKYDKPIKEQAISPPTFIDQLNMRNHTMLDKSNSSLAKVSNKDKIEYAKVKLDELNEIKSLYVQNGGQKNEFKSNVDKMVQFYQKFLNEELQRQKEEDNRALNDSQNLIQSRCSTPILKLRDFNQDAKKSQQNVSNVKKITKTSEVKGFNSNNQANNQIFNPNFQQYPFQPPIYMMPYPPQQAQSSPNDSMRLLQKMIELKSEENKQLLQILREDRKKGNQPIAYIPFPQQGIQQPPSPQDPSVSEKKEEKPYRKGCIDVTEDYQFKKSMIQDLISEQKVLLALQQEELDELKLLSQLPKQLQEIKIKSTLKAADTRFQVQKQLLKQKMIRLAYQEQNQTFEEERKLTNDRWAGQQRKKLLEKQLDRYVGQFQNQFLPDEED